MIRQKDIAEALGIDQSQVSRAFKGDPRVSRATRERILAEAARMGYRPTVAASALAGRRHHRIRDREVRLAVITPNASDRLDRMIASEAEALGYGVEIVRVDSFADLEVIGRQLWSTGVAGLILTTTDLCGDDPARAADFEWDRFSIVKVRRVMEEIRCPTVRVSAAEMLEEGLHQLYRLGYRSIHCEMIRTPSRTDDHARLGVLAGHRTWHAPSGVTVNWCFSDGGAATLAGSTVEQRLEESRADVLFAFPSSLGFRLLEGGWRIPEDIALAGYAIDEGQAVGGLQVSGVNRNLAGQARAAVAFLHEQVCRGVTGLSELPSERVVSPFWQTGETAPKTAGPRE